MTNFSIGALRASAINDLQEAAGQARTRYMTAIAAQGLVYAAKLAQAEAYIAAHATDGEAPVPAYVAAEVAAVGGTALAAAQAIVAAASAFHAGPGPAIEQARRAGKLAIQAATTAEDVAAALADALGALQALGAI